MRRHQRPPTAAHPVSGAALLLLTVLILLSGCAPAWPFPQPTPDPRLPDSQQILRVHEVGEGVDGVRTLDPALIESASDQAVAQLIFPQLVTLDEQQRVVDWAAASHSVSDDGLTYMFHLRKGLVWSDGSPIDSTAFAYSINRGLDPCTGSYVASDLYPIKGAQAFNAGRCPMGAIKSATTLIGSALLTPDPLTLQITLERPAGYFLVAMTNSVAWATPQALVERYAQPATSQNGGYPVVTSTWTEHLGDNGGFGGNPFTFVSWTRATNERPGEVILERNERFFGHKPLLRRIDYVLYRSEDAAWRAFAAGDGDVSIVPLRDQHGPYNASLEWARTLKEVTAQQTALLTTSSLRFSSQLAPFDDPHVRKAFALAIDRRAIAHDIYQDTVQPSIHVLPEGLPGYNPHLTDPAARTGTEALAPDLETARRLASAYAAEKCSGNYALCPTVTYFVRRDIGGFTARGKMANLLVAQWRQAFPGWTVELYDGCHIQVCESKPHQLDNTNWGANYPDPQDFLSNLWTTSAYYNHGSVSIPQVDALCAQADRMSALATRIPLYQQAEQLLITQVAAVPLYQTLDAHAVRSRVVGWHLAPTGQTPLSVWQATYLTK